MSPATARQRLSEEISQIPDSQVEAVYDLVHGFRRSQMGAAERDEILSLGGSWAHLSDEEFSAFLSDLAERRRVAGRSRRQHAAGSP